MVLLLIASLWQGPLPWLHQHAVAAESGWLREHVSVYHERGDSPALDWHLHFATAREIARGAGYPVPENDDEKSERLPVIPETAVSLDSAVVRGGVFHVDLIRVGDLAESGLSVRAARTPVFDQTFFGHLAAQRGLSTIFCVSRC